MQQSASDDESVLAATGAVCMPTCRVPQRCVHTMYARTMVP